DAALHPRFVDAALFEAGHWSHLDLLDDVPTLYFGGGTPTLMGDELVRLVRGLTSTARLRSDAEITVETNPETTSPTLVAALTAAGVNRFSLGVQSFDDAVLRTLGRGHDAAKAAEACSTLVRAGVDFSIDLICGVPGQDIASWRETLERAAQTGAVHFSVYPLAIEPGTPLAEDVDEGRMPAPDPDMAADMMVVAREYMARHAVERYEVANYAYPGHEARHNTAYWTGGAYLGIGPGAHSMLPYDEYARVADAEGWQVAGPEPGAGAAVRVRFAHAPDTDVYVREPLARPTDDEHLDADDTAREDVMLGLRLTRGVPEADVASAGLTPVLERLAADGLAELVAGRWRTTERGWLLGNEVFGAVWAGE
ncbi:MAG: coproporphyrinogen-III oxidase family protein, partial [Coriobacteriia bacterium]|nr:coproporphyrinogen-III oxidase family protein [Coriobacteriia bacterium]